MEMLKKHKKVIECALIASVIAFFLLGYFAFRSIFDRTVMNSPDRYEIPPNQKWIASNIDHDHLGLTFSSVLEEDMGVGLSMGIYESEWAGNILSEEIQDFFTVQVQNTTFTELNLLLKIFYNYEELDFQILDDNEYHQAFSFLLDGETQVDIPIQVPKNFADRDSINQITVGVFFAPEYFVINDSELGEDLRSSPGLMVNYGIDKGSNEALTLSADALDISGDSEFFGFAIHTNPEPPGGGAVWAFPSITAQQGTELELTFSANVESSDYLIISMLDWHQISMNSNPYLWVEASNDESEVGQHGQFSIQVPEEVGFYEFLAFLVPHPTKLNSAETFFPLEMVRLTLEVVE